MRFGYLSAALLFFLFTCIIDISIALEREYKPAYDASNWEVVTDELSCKLTYNIADYGVLSFSQQAGFLEAAELKIFRNRGVAHSRAIVEFVSPEWHPNVLQQHGWRFQVVDSKQTITFSNRQARQILDNIDAGFMTIIRHTDNTDRRNIAVAKVLPVLFHANYLKYTKCQDEIVPVSFDDIKKSNIYFETGSVRLDHTAKQWLEYIVAYAKTPYLRRIELGGYTDSVGSFRANHKLASLRVEEVRKHLLDAGFNEKQIKIRVYGEQRAIDSNLTPQGRANNRRVEVKIYR